MFWEWSLYACLISLSSNQGFYFDFEKEAPGPLVKTTSEIINEIDRLERVGFHQAEQLQKFYQTFYSLKCVSQQKELLSVCLLNKKYKQ